MSAAEANEHHVLKAKIEEWLESEGIAFSSVSDLNSFFHIQADLKNVPIHISESKVRKGVLAVQGSMELAPDQLEKYQSIRAEDKKALFLALFAMLDKTEYHYMLQENFAVKNWLKIQRPLYIEDLTRTMLLNEIKNLNTRFVNINYLVNETLAEFKPATDESSMYK